MTQQCTAPAPSPQGSIEQVGGKSVVAGSEFSESSSALRDRGVELAGANNLWAALPYFFAAVAVSPLDPQAHSDEGVTWMRLKEWAPSWGAFKRALTIDPNHATAMDNKRQLINFLSNTPDGARIMAADEPNPPPRQPRQREHTILPIPRLSALPTGKDWWKKPFIVTEVRGRKKRERAANKSSLEKVPPAHVGGVEYA